MIDAKLYSCLCIYEAFKSVCSLNPKLGESAQSFLYTVFERIVLYLKVSMINIWWGYSLIQ